MKNLLVIFGSLLLAGCVMPNYQFETQSDSDPDVSANGDYGNWGNYEKNLDCSKISFVSTELNGTQFWLQVPTICDPGPYIYQGDPDPDFVNPYRDGDGLASVEDIMKSAKPVMDRYFSSSDR